MIFILVSPRSSHLCLFSKVAPSTSMSLEVVIHFKLIDAVIEQKVTGRSYIIIFKNTEF